MVDWEMTCNDSKVRGSPDDQLGGTGHKQPPEVSYATLVEMPQMSPKPSTTASYASGQENQVRSSNTVDEPAVEPKVEDDEEPLPVAYEVPEEETGEADEEAPPLSP